MIAPAAFQGVGRLEQRDHVEDRDRRRNPPVAAPGSAEPATRPARGRPARRRRRTGEADHVPVAAAARGGSGCAAIARNVARTSAGGHARRDLQLPIEVARGRSAASAAPWTSLCWRTSSPARWKPNVSTCQRKSWSSPQATRPRPVGDQRGLRARRAQPAGPSGRGSARRPAPAAAVRAPASAGVARRSPRTAGGTVRRGTADGAGARLRERIVVGREPRGQRRRDVRCAARSAAIVCISRMATAS